MPIFDISKLAQFTAINVLSDPGAIGGPIVIPNGIQVRLVWTLTDGKFATNVMYGSVSGSFNPTVAIANSLMTGFSTGALWTALAAFMPSTGQLTSVVLRDVRNPNLPLVGSTASAAAGASASPALPDETAVVITLRTANVGQGNRGRLYIPNFATNALAAGNVVAPAVVTALQNWANNFPTVLSGQGLTFGLGQRERAAYISPTTGTSHPARPAQIKPVTSQTVRDNHWDTQRRRGLK